VAFDFKPVHACHFSGHIREAGIYVKNPPASVAYKMVMLMAVMVVMGGAVEVADVQQLPRIRHLAEVPVNSGLADGGMLFHHLRVDLFSRCVYVKLPHSIKDQLSLYGISFTLHVF